MATEFIGLIVGADTRTVYSLVNPDDDADLDDPRHLELGNKRGEPVRIVKLLRADYHQPDHPNTPVQCRDGANMTLDDVAGVIVRWYVMSSEIETRADHIEGAV